MPSMNMTLNARSSGIDNKNRMRMIAGGRGGARDSRQESRIQNLSF